MRLAVAILTTGILLSAEGWAAARTDPYAVFFGTDNRSAVDSSSAPWDAVGRINSMTGGGFVFCSGALVAPDIVATNERCVHGLDLRRIRFVTGDLRGAPRENARVKCVSDSRDPGRASGVSLLVLDHSLKTQPLKLYGDVIADDSQIAAAGYYGDRPFIVSAHLGCHVRYADGELLVTDCDYYPGQSGGPVLIKSGKEWLLAAVTSFGKDPGGTFAVPVRSLQQKLQNLACH